MLSLLLSLTIFFASAGFASAAPPDSSNRPTGSVDKPADSAGKLANRCTAVKRVLANRLNNYNVRQDNHITTYTKAHEHWLNLAARLKTAGLDTAKFESDLAAMKVLIDQADFDYQAFVDTMEATQSLDCQEATSGFLSSLAEARATLQSFRERSRQIHTFMRTTIRPDLTALRSQFNQPTPTP